MEMIIIAGVALIAFAAVLIPLFKQGSGNASEREFEGDPEPGGSRPVPHPASGEGVIPPMAAGPATPVTGAAAAPEPDLPETDPSPMVEAPVPGGSVRPAPHAPVPGAAHVPAAGTPAPEDDLEQEVLRYREALRAGTVCNKCGQANPPGSRFCFDCGKALPLADAREFD
jgi:hypothetical protein